MFLWRGEEGCPGLMCFDDDDTYRSCLAVFSNVHTVILRDAPAIFFVLIR